MNKILCFVVAALLMNTAADAQLAKTKWSGVMKLPQEDGSLRSVPVEWEFGKDTLTVRPSGSEPEIFTFKDVKKVLTMIKVSGESPCPDGAKITIVYTINDGIFSFTNQTSDCDTYKKVQNDASLRRIK